jgi:hypothetical protein
MLCVTEWRVEVTNHRLALDLLEAWRGADGTRREAAVTGRLADLAACGSPATVEQIVVALTALADTFLELYADTAAAPVGWVLREAAVLTPDDGPQTWGGPAY